MYKTWDERFKLAKNYYEHYGHLRVKASFKTKDGITYDEEGFKLGIWINAQRASYKLGELTMKHTEKLKSIGMVFENVNDVEWDIFYNQMVIFLEKHKTLFIPNDFKTKNGYERDENGKNLGAWWHVQKFNYSKKTLSEQRTKKIEQLYSSLKKIEEVEWMKMYALAQKYYKEYNTLIIKKTFSLIGEDGEPVDLSELGSWVSKQRRDYKEKKLSSEKIKKLEEIGIIFENISQNEWDRMYKLACIYSKEHGNLKVPRSFKTKNGADYDKNGSPLGKWINAQYSNNCNGSLTLEHKQKLEKIGMSFINQVEKNWEEMLKLVNIYSKTYGHFNIPINFKTKDGITYSEDGKDIGSWLSRQKSNGIGNRLAEEHRKKLENIGFVFDNCCSQEWEKMYGLAKAFYEKYKNLNIPLEFKTKDGITSDENGDDLYNWIHKQQFLYNSKTLSKEKILKLKEIGMINRSCHEDNWNYMYNLAKAYYLEYHDLKVKIEFKTKDGITYSEDGENLGCWISTQRYNFRKGLLSETRIKKLQLIGMIFEISKNKQQNECVCIAYGIDYKKYKKEVDVIPYREFIAKINYLNDNSIPFIINNQLHPIFFTSSMNMTVRYGLSLEQMIIDYEKQAGKSKQFIKMGV